jgi:hypothetical protein
LEERGRGGDGGGGDSGEKEDEDDNPLKTVRTSSLIIHSKIKKENISTRKK